MTVRGRDKGSGLRAGGVNRKATLAAAFGFVHGAVGGAEKFVGGVAIAAKIRINRAIRGSRPGAERTVSAISPFRRF